LATPDFTLRLAMPNPIGPCLLEPAIRLWLLGSALNLIPELMQYFNRGMTGITSPINVQIIVAGSLPKAVPKIKAQDMLGLFIYLKGVDYTILTPGKI